MRAEGQLANAAEASVLEASGLSKRFGSRAALADVSFSVRQGEIFGFLGPNGAGKTTTIRIMLGLIRPDGGQIRIGGADSWSQHVEAARHFGAAVEVPGFYGYLTGRENLHQFARLLAPVPEGQIEQVLGLVGLTERADDRVAKYSLGMRQRLAIAQALLGRPQLLILDEPTNGLDPGGIAEVRSLLRRLAGEEGLTLFLSSHLLSEVQEVCSRVAVIHQGRIRTEGSVAELTQPKVHEFELSVTDVALARTVLGAFPGVRVTNGREPEHLHLSSDDDIGQEAVRRLVTAGVGVQEIRRVRRSLEDVFLELTGP